MAPLEEAVAADDAHNVLHGDQRNERQQYCEPDEVDEPFPLRGNALATAYPFDDDEEDAPAVEGRYGQDVDDGQ